MPRFSAELSVSGLERLIKDLQSYQQKVEDAPAKIVQALTASAEEHIRQNLRGIADKDGNLQASAGSSAEGNTGSACLQGKQAPYLEYGTGIIGKRSPHPLSKDAGWEYGSGPRVFTTKDGRVGWAYQDPRTGRWKFTQGIPAEMPVYRAAQALRGEVAEIAREALK